MTSAAAPSRPLRVGLMLDSLTVPAWIAHIVEELDAAPFTEPALVIVNDEPAETQPRFARLRSPRRQRLLFNLYRRFDARLFGVERNAFAEVDVGGALASVPRLEVMPLRPRPFEHRFPAPVVEQVRAEELDVLFRFGFNIIRGEILDCARYGVWSYHHGDNREYRGSPDFFWEMYEGNPVTGTMLQILTEDLDAGKILYRSASATDPASMHRGRNRAYWKTAEFAIRCLRVLHERGFEYLAHREDETGSAPYTKGIYRTPTNRQILGFLARTAGGIAGRQARKFVVRDSWYVALRRGASVSVLDAARSGSISSAERFRSLRAAREHYYADPFVVSDPDGAPRLFLEEHDWRMRKGFITTMALDERGPVGRGSVALACDYHLSYPFVAREGSDWFMFPETCENRTVEMFRAERYPDRWRLDRVLLSDIEAVDPTLLHYDGLLWLFVNVAVPGASVEDELCLFYAESLHGEWTPHPLNPVVSDVRRSRPAGRIVRSDGMLIRPSQDSSRRYGGALVFNRIDVLTPADYAETPLGRIDPARGRGNVGTHTYNTESGWEVLDGERVRLHFGRPAT